MNNKNNTLITVGLTIISLIMMILLVFQNNTINSLKDIIEKTDTTTTITIDTLYLEKTYTDTVPKYITQRIYKTDTVYKKEGDSISATPMLITLKKKKSPTQL
jgi:hypothetical protein